MKLECNGFFFETEESELGTVITGAEGDRIRLTVPDRIVSGNNEYVIAGVERKAFLGLKLKELSLPGSIRMINDWAFAQMTGLERFEIRAEGYSNLTLGKGVFEGDLNLKSVSFGFDDEDLSVLLASTVNRLPAQFLLRTKDLGTDGWFSGYDSALKAYIEEDDFTGYSERILCGEEDISYDGIGSVDGELLGESEAYVLEKRKSKSRLCLMRLLHDRNLTDQYAECFRQYIKDHARGMKDESAWRTLKDDLKDSLEYVSLYCDIVKPDGEGVDAMLLDMGKGNPQVKAFLIEYGKGADDGDFFDNLEL